MKTYRGERMFDMAVYAVGALVLILILYPLLFVLSASFSNPAEVLSGRMWLYPVGWSTEAYNRVFDEPAVWTGFRNSLLYASLGTLVNLALTLLAAYPLSRPDLPGRSWLMFVIVFTMFFQGGIIPTYLIVSDLGLVDTIWSMILPGAIATYNLIVMRTYFQTSIPWELQQAAMIDGCSDANLLLRVILPLSKPIVAVLVLFYAVGHWNAFFNALIYLQNRDLFPLQLVLREILVMNQASYLEGAGNTFGMEDRLLLSESIKYALIVVSIVPVLVLYPFVQRHFVKGVMIGSIKG